jgi:lipoate-protein ligase B
VPCSWPTHRAADSDASGGEETLVVARLGLADYDEALALQEALRERRLRAVIPDTLVLLEHPSVYTLGRNANSAHLGCAAGGPIPVRRVGRGGEVTYHGPGQLVGYGIVDLFRRGLSVRQYVRGLEEAVIRTAAAFGVQGTRVTGQPGVWVGPRKLASVGIGLRRWVSTHGFALNVATDLSHFDAIVPCGLTGVRMTSLAAEGVRVALDHVTEVAGRCFAEVLGHPSVRPLDWTMGDWSRWLAATGEPRHG